MHPLRLLSTCLLALLMGASGYAQDNAERSARARAELDALRDKIDNVRQQIASDRGQRSDLADQLSNTEADISAASKRLRKLDENIAGLQQRVASLTDRRDTERAQLTDRLETLRQQVRAAYSSGRMDKMRLLLSGQSPEKMGRLLVYYEYFADAQTGQVNDLRDALADLAVRQRALTQEQDKLAAQRKSRAGTLTKLENNQQQRRQTIAALDRRLSSRKASLEELRSNEDRLENLMKSLQQQLATLPDTADDNTPFARLKGRMTPPVGGQTLARFGTPKAGGPLRWKGEWLAASQGAPVKAVAGGRVVYVGYMHRYGLIVILDHGDNYYTLYGHAESTYVEVGDQVRRGQPVAKAGHSGGHRRSGTYFELRKGRTAINPASWLSG